MLEQLWSTGLAPRILIHYKEYPNNLFWLMGVKIKKYIVHRKCGVRKKMSDIENKGKYDSFVKKNLAECGFWIR